MKPKNLFLLTLFVSLKTCRGGPCQEFHENCSTKSAQCTITCTDPLDATTCVADTPGATCPTDVTTTPMDKNVCKGYCTQGITCFYYKWQEISGIQNCYLMGETECADWGETCEPSYCDSGKAEDNKCEEGDNGVPDPGFTCPGETTHEAGTMPNFKLHWSCISLSSGDVNIKDETVPGDTKCTAYPECNGELVSYECESNEESSPKGVWKYKGNPLNDPNFLEDNADGEKKLTDPICNADDLTLTDYENQVAIGMEILCVEADVASDGTVGTVAAQNSCLLICDGYPILNFYTVKQSWKYKLMEGAETDLTLSSADDVIYCHKAEGSGAEDQDV